MAEFTVNADVTTAEPRVEVTISPDRPMAIGRQRFRLIVVDDAGNRSNADEVIVIIADQEAPTAVLRAPRITAFGRSFELDGSASFDVGGGQVVQYVWTYLGPDRIG
jgi:hypothetical protein